MRRKLACWCILVPFAACDSTRPGSAPAPSPIFRSYALSGTVAAEGRPVSGATVTLLTLDTGVSVASTTTDVDGSYRLSGVANPYPVSEALVSVSKADYFTLTRYVLMSRDAISDFALERAAYIAVGDQIQSRPIGARCASSGYGGDGGAICQRFALKAAVSGTLEVTVSSSPPSPFDGTILRPDGTIGVYGSVAAAPLRLTIGVLAGLTYQIDVVPLRGPDFTLTTTLL